MNAIKNLSKSNQKQIKIESYEYQWNSLYKHKQNIQNLHLLFQLVSQIRSEWTTSNLSSTFVGPHIEENQIHNKLSDLSFAKKAF